MVRIVAEDIDPPMIPVPWGIHGLTGVSWLVGGSWQYIVGSCVIKQGPEIDLGLDPHQPCSFGLNMVCAGTGRYRDRDGREQRLAPGAVFMRHPRQAHTVFIDEGDFIECYLSLRTVTWEHLRGLGAVEPQPVFWPRDPLAVRDVFALIFGLLDGGGSADAPRLLTELLRMLALIRDERVGGEADPHRELVARACRRLDYHLADPIDLRALAADLGVGYEAFRKIFRQRMGLAPGAYRVQKRIDRACALLTNARQPVAEIAEALGYSDAFAFSAQFKRSTGLSPSAYRRRTAGEGG